MLSFARIILPIQRFEIETGIIAEPVEGAHRNIKEAAELLSETLENTMNELLALPVETLLALRNDRLRNLGQYGDALDKRQSVCQVHSHCLRADQP